MKGRIGSAGLVAAGLLLICSVAISQVAPTQTGRRLDSNPQVGSGGYNAPTGGTAGVNSQLYVSGLIGSGSGQIPTGRLLDRSLQIGSGGYNVVSGGVGGVNPQLFMNRQVQGLGLFRGDVPYQTLRATPPAVRAPGAAVVPDINKTVDPELAKSLYADVTEDYASVAKVPPGQGISAVVPLVPAPTGVTPQVARAAPTRAERPGTSALFGILWQEDRQQLAAELQELPTDNRISARIDSETWPFEEPKTEEGSLVTVQPGPLGVAQTRPADSATRDQDVFWDILRELQNLRKADVAVTKWPTVEVGTAAVGTPTTQEADKANVVLVEGLAGRRRNEFNLRLATGQQYLKEGKYYSAADQFDLAALARPTNPLAKVGWGLALLAAGEPLNAAGRFRDALEVFPPIMETRFNFAKMVDAEHLKNRTTDVNRMVNAEHSSDTMLVFLSCYLAFNARSPVDSKFYGKKLAEVARDDEILAAYANFVLTGKRPDQAKKKAGEKPSSK